MNKSLSQETRPEVGEIMDSIRYIFRALRVASITSEKQMGLSAAQLFVLKKIEEKPGLSINELASRTTTHQSSVSVVVKKLEEQKLLQRKFSKDDSRKAMITLTTKGKRLLDKAPPIIQERMINSLQEMSPQETLQLSLHLQNFIQRAGLAEDGGPAPMFEEKTDPTT